MTWFVIEVNGAVVKSRQCLWANVAEAPEVFPLLRAHNLAKRFPQIQQPGFQDPRTQHALIVIDAEYDAVRLESMTAAKP